MSTAIEVMRERAADVVRELLGTAPAGSIRAAFAGGSVARDEVWSSTRDGHLSIYSDLDLYVVLADGADEAAVRAAAAAIRARGERASVDFHRDAEIGVYTLADLLAQPARPGTVDLAEHHFWLHGDRAVVAELRRLARPIPAEEALYLLENRAWDALRALHEQPALARVTSAKVLLDVLSAHLIAEGRFATTQDARWRALGERVPAGLDGPAMNALAAANAIRRGDDSLTLEPARSLAIVGHAWRTLAPSIVGGEQVPARLLATRCARGAAVANMREFVRMRARSGASLAEAAIGSLRFGELAPRAALRTHALVRAWLESGVATADQVGFHSRYVARLCARLRIADGTLDERARAALGVVS